MKFIQSFWSKPFEDDDNRNNWNYRHHGGFPTSFIFYCVWCYSCLSIKKYYPSLHLITDEVGLYIFQELLGLPYESFSRDLDALDDYDKKLWALGKLHAYRIQEEPFCHVDGDVFFFGPVLNAVLAEQVFCQSFDHNIDQYTEIHSYVHDHFNSVPIEFNATLDDKIKLINAGIIGGTDVELFRFYTKKAFELIDHNRDKIKDINVGILNLYYEQFLFSNILTEKQIEPSSLFKSNDRGQNFAAFHDIPGKSRYIHLISHFKKSTEFLELAVARLISEYPEYYDRVKTAFDKGWL
ncbi:DUF6734 family protein [Flagellimonas aequoris]|uniref:DUF6734 domain-containing protein n=1 Tax=Flagellimonas aequoris TaxID=2306997 RepID=A0A418N8E3_9FLAO|nr:DUF6734 family protein [Allomuricauda aequoris]RIV71161.1 hypothetical protein D2U88_08510 [Allomuricauda aequoris]